MSTVLVVDDEPQMRTIVEFALQTHGFTVHTAPDGATALNLLSRRHVDLVVLDVLMPVLDGLTVCERIRATSDVPIILLTALSQHEDVIAGLERGADDYVAKPFHPREVALRAAALIRRANKDTGKDTMKAGKLGIDARQRVATFDGVPLDLPYTEFALLAHLARYAGQPQSWRDLLRAVWGTTELIGGRDIVKSTVYRLRSRLAALPGAAGYVQTVRGVGYLMPEDPKAG
ncbi:response regulator transcription factor [Nonomuraea sp. NN258]|uniref:response regulator transcription factor n=1 Tax=Nonomuraea antri TaxID=2730852 RepID=UPI00156976BA|nr:response regulator transcription factor [Nonomuraea antri]NRQ32797.1 response regulator transcription factor [Nonomuraea antri]